MGLPSRTGLRSRLGLGNKVPTWPTRNLDLLKTSCCPAWLLASQRLPLPPSRVKLLVQNQNEMLKQGTLDRPYNGVLDCTKRVLTTEGIYPFWRGNLANVLRYFPTQALNFAFKDTV